MTGKITQTLRTLGITPVYHAFPCTVFAVSLALEDASRLDYVMRDVYLVAAKEYHMDPRNLERNIRTMIQRAWQVDRAKLSELAGYKLDAPPSVSQFLEIIANSTRSSAS